jgi:dethiobiotin synthetase
VSAIIVTGTDTDISKTVFCAGLTRLLGGTYWKPIQAGLEGETDTDTVRRLAELPNDRLLPEAWRLKMPASPHWAAEDEGIAIEPSALTLPALSTPLIVEGAGGLLVPLTRSTFLIDVMARWRAPTVLCARTGLGTLNHTLLSVEALRRRGIPLLGVAFIGDAHPDNERTIASMGTVCVLGRLRRLDPLTPATLGSAFEEGFSRAAFLSPGAP